MHIVQVIQKASVFFKWHIKFQYIFGHFVFIVQKWTYINTLSKQEHLIDATGNFIVQTKLGESI